MYCGGFEVFFYSLVLSTVSVKVSCVDFFHGTRVKLVEVLNFRFLTATELLFPTTARGLFANLNFKLTYVACTCLARYRICTQHKWEAMIIQTVKCFQDKN